MVDREWQTAASYYRVYQENPSLTTSVAAATTTNATDHTDNAIWEEYQWTTEEEDAAKQKLQALAHKCRKQSTAAIASNETAWNQFYSQHQDNFFKDRHYLKRVFSAEIGSSASPSEQQRQHRVLVEVGCGVGNTLLPLLQDNNFDDDDHQCHRWTVHGLDVSSVAVDILRQNPVFQAAARDGRAFAHVCDITRDSAPFVQLTDQATVTSLLFCLSAIDPDYHEIAVKKAASTLQPGGVLVFRDYGRYDEAQMKLASQRNKLVKDNFYQKHDGTMCYYFTIQELQDLFCEGAGLEQLELEYIRRIYKNRNDGTTRRRVWIQGRFQKPAATCTSTKS